MKIIAACLVLLPALFARAAGAELFAPPADTNAFHIFLLMGQSNMVGRDTNGLASQADNPRILALNADGKWVLAKDPLHFQEGRIPPGVGPGISFAGEMLKAETNVTIGLVPCAVGGTPLRRWVKGGDLYEKALGRARLAAQSGVIKGVLWHQGESDSDKQQYAETYEARLARMLMALRQDLGAPDLPIVVGQLGNFLMPEKHPYVDIVRAAIKNIPVVVPHTGYADSAGLGDKGDQLHFSAEAQKEMGVRYAKAMQDLPGEPAVPAAHIARFAGDRAAAISYTFDDGLRDQFTLAVPMLNEAGFKGTFFIVPGKTAETPEAAAAKQFEPKVMGSISWPELKMMAGQGHEIASHTWSHRNQAKITAAEADAELSKSFDTIKTRMGKPPLTLAFPYNQSTPEVRTNALKYYVAYRAYQVGTGSNTTTASLNHWADKLVKEQKWGILMTHAITNGYAAMSDPEVLHGHLKYVKGRAGDIWVDTFANIARYERERDDATLKLTREADGVTCVISNSLDSQLYNVPLTVVINAPGIASARAKRAGQELPVRVGHGTICVEAAPDAQPITITFGDHQLY